MILIIMIMIFMMMMMMMIMMIIIIMMMIGIEHAEYREVYVSVKNGYHPILSKTFNPMIEDLRRKRDKKQSSNSYSGASKSSSSEFDDVFNNMIMCKVELKGRMLNY